MPRKYTNHLPLDTQAKLRKQAVNLTDRRFGKLLVESLAGRHKGTLYWHCLCDCGQRCIKRGSNLTGNRHTKSCGCLSGNPYLDGLSQTCKPEYNAWKDMITRCSNPQNESYHRYGGRGIKVCERWVQSFKNFLADMGKRPSSEHSIDRYPDKNGNYEFGNCRWATRKQQQRNMRSNRLIVINGKSKPVAEWAEIFNRSYELVCRRLRHGWSEQDAILFDVAHQSYKFRKRNSVVNA